MDEDRIPDGWTLWNHESDGRVVLTYRPDVFDGEAFPAACLPTLYLAGGSRRRRPGPARTPEGDHWEVTFFLEPEVELDAGGTYDSRDRALEGLFEAARRFAEGEIDVRSAYQVPRDAYLDRLETLTGREP